MIRGIRTKAEQPVLQEIGGEQSGTIRLTVGIFGLDAEDDHMKFPEFPDERCGELPFVVADLAKERYRNIEIVGQIG